LRRVRYTAPVVPNEPVEDRAPLSQPHERADLVSTHEAAVALNICCEDCHEARLTALGRARHLTCVAQCHLWDQSGLGGSPSSIKEAFCLLRPDVQPEGDF
jgi:hypothetical protein